MPDRLPPWAQLERDPRPLALLRMELEGVGDEPIPPDTGPREEPMRAPLVRPLDGRRRAGRRTVPLPDDA